MLDPKQLRSDAAGVAATVLLVGAVGALQNLTLEQIKAFYSSNYTRANVVIGLAGGYPA